MPETDQQDKTLSELVVKEAVERGLETPMRETILEAVEQSEGTSNRGRLPLVGAVFGLGAALGFLAGQQSSDMETPSLEDVEEPEIIEEVSETAAEQAGKADLTEDEPEESTGRRFPRMILALGAIAAAVLVGRRLLGDEEDEWEPIEEFEPATESDTDEETADETESDMAESDEADAETVDEDQPEE